MDSNRPAPHPNDPVCPEMKLGLGTVQFGLDYGISNTTGQPAPDDVASILDLAQKAGIRVLDTAATYGTSEEVLGHVLPPKSDFRIVSKLPITPPSGENSNWSRWCRSSLQVSLDRLNRSQLDGYLAHRPAWLLSPDGDRFYRALASLKDQGHVEKIGASVYTVEEALELVRRYDLDLLQVPLSIADQRFLADGVLGKLRARGIEIHARSVFLQGLLLMNLDTLPVHFEPARPTLAAFRSFCRESGVSALKAAISFAIGQTDTDVVLVGVNRRRDLAEILDSLHNPVPAIDWRRFAIENIDIVNPSLWPE